MKKYTQEQREQAARVLEAIQDKFAGYDADRVFAFNTAIACLCSPGASPDVDGKAGGWVRTSERMPTEEDALDGEVLFADRYGLVGAYSYTTADYTYEDGRLVYPYWMPLLPLPEVDNG